MLQAPAYGGRNQRSFTTRQLVAVVLGSLFWSLAIIGLAVGE
jgi:hypothetical protein